MGNKERTDKFNEVSSVKTGDKASFSTRNLKNAQHEKWSDCDAAKDITYSNSGKKYVQNEKLFVLQGNARNSKSESKNSKEANPGSANFDSSEWKPVQGRRNKSEKHRKVYENQIFTQNMNKEKFKPSERHTVQSFSRQPIPNKTLNARPGFRVQSKTANSNLMENKMESTHKNSKNYSSNVGESINAYNNSDENAVKEKFGVSNGELNSRERRGNETKNLVLSSEVTVEHSLESDAKNCLKDKGAIAKNSQHAQTFVQAAEKTCNSIANIKEQNLNKDKSELEQEKDKVLQSDILVLNETASHQNCATIPCNQMKETIGYLEEISEDWKINLTNEENVHDKVTDVHEYQHSVYMPQLKCEANEKNLDHELKYCRYNNGYYLQCRPVTIYPLHPYVHNSTYGQPIDGYLDSGASCQHFSNEQFNESHSSEFQNVINHDQEQCNPVSVGNEQGLECERNNCPNSNGFIYHSANLNYGYCVPFILSWCENGMQYYQYYPNFSPVQCPCFVPGMQ